MIQILLFVATFLSTYIAGNLMQPGSGLLYAVPLMLILLCHEGGHYLMCRRYGVRTTLPTFIPAPYTLFGTFGALIFMKQNVPSRKAVFDIGAAGPVCGFVVAIPVVVAGLSLSTIVEAEGARGGLLLGEPLMFKLLAHLQFGELPQKHIMLHPAAFAGWIGLLVTALNLLPAGQLDGGHILYAVLGRRSALLFWPLACGLILMSVAFESYAYSLFIILLVIFGRRHPPPVDDRTGLDRGRKLIALGMLAILVLCFTPVPISLA